MIDDLEIGPWIKDPNPVMIRSWKIFLGHFEWGISCKSDDHHVVQMEIQPTKTEQDGYWTDI